VELHVDVEPDEDVVEPQVHLPVVDLGADDLQENEAHGGFLPDHQQMEERQQVVHIVDEPPPVMLGLVPSLGGEMVQHPHDVSRNLAPPVPGRCYPVGPHKVEPDLLHDENCLPPPVLFEDRDSPMSLGVVQLEQGDGDSIPLGDGGYLPAVLDAWQGDARRAMSPDAV